VDAGFRKGSCSSNTPQRTVRQAHSTASATMMATMSAP
jgi:hypothetical protein